MPIRITWRDTSATRRGAARRRHRWSCVRPLADVFLRSIGSIPDRFSNESRGLNAERTSRNRSQERRGRRAGETGRGISRSKGWSSPRVAGANSNNRARLGERYRAVVTRANPKYCYPPRCFHVLRHHRIPCGIRRSLPFYGKSPKVAYGPA